MGKSISSANSEAKPVECQKGGPQTWSHFTLILHFNMKNAIHQQTEYGLLFCTIYKE